MCVYKGKKLKVESFKNWLGTKGAQVLESTNEYEVVRFHANQITSVVYRNKENRITSFINEAEYVLNCYLLGREWDAGVAVSRSKRCREKKQQIIDTLVARDGSVCFYCNKHLFPEQITLEHLIPISLGGPDHLCNLFLCCLLCNNQAGSMNVVDKIKLREMKRGYDVKITSDNQ